ncbi:lipopolysaccharide-binding protein-like isoform X2 [Clavelina lepadiformis]
MKNLLCLLGYLALMKSAVPSIVEGTNPGIIARLNPAGIDYVKQYASSFLGNAMQSFRVPDIDTPFGFAFTDLSIESLDEGDLSLNLESPNTIVLEMDDAAITIMSKANFIGVKLEGIDFYGIFHLERGLEGQPQINLQNCSSAVDKLSLKSGEKELAEINSGILSLVDGSVTDFLEMNICSYVQEAFVRWNTNVKANIPFIFETSLFLELVRPVEVDAASFTEYFSGRITPSNNLTISYPFSAQPTLALAPSSRMFQMSISDYVINTFLNSLSENDFFTWTLKDKEVSMKLGFSVESVAFLLPNLIPYIGKEKLFLVTCNTPLAEIVSAELQASASCKGLVKAVEDDFSEATLVSMELDVQASGKITLEQQTLSAYVTDMSVQLKSSSGIEEPVVKIISQFLKIDYLLPFVNDFVGSYELPENVANILTNISLQLKENSVELVTDFDISSLSYV